jgi:hypothetical protein
MQINIESGVKYINQYVTTQDETTEEEEEFESQPQSLLPDSETDWDSDENWREAESPVSVASIIDGKKCDLLDMWLLF